MGLLYCTRRRRAKLQPLRARQVQHAHNFLVAGKCRRPRKRGSKKRRGDKECSRDDDQKRSGWSQNLRMQDAKSAEFALFRRPKKGRGTLGAGKERQVSDERHSIATFKNKQVNE
ncbi:hypothetical protein L596_012488 [Steinernema carpocapsae]|uniref:Uncharacterized protein n=1 Tax=Steinernema carpocapsae TaxID=34508 RepID=A0A4U5NX67_STECR|nr:hypothetical protein L596_012488 [Steinernema carpocapsae]